MYFFWQKRLVAFSFCKLDDKYQITVWQQLGSVPAGLTFVCDFRGET